MPIKPTRVEISFIPGRIKRLLNFGREHDMRTSNGKLKPAPITASIVSFMLNLRADSEVDQYLETHGGTLQSLIRHALKKYISK